MSVEVDLELIRSLQAMMGDTSVAEALGYIDMDKVALAMFKVMNVPPEWVRSPEELKTFRIRSAAARRGWAKRRAKGELK